MTDKTVRKFEKLRIAYETAREVRKAASSARREIKSLNGGALTISALGSKAGAKAVEAELDALREERRTLKRLAAYAVRHAAEAQADSNVTTDLAAPGTAAEKTGKAKKARSAKATAGSEPKLKGGKARKA